MSVISFSKAMGLSKTLFCICVFITLVWLSFAGIQSFHSKRSVHVDSCDVNCTTGVPCQYRDELDFRIIVLTYNRPASLKRCLARLSQLDTLGDRVGVNIWIDRSPGGDVDHETLVVAGAFQSTWRHGRVCVHIQTRNAYIIGQWVDTWRPHENSRELALILEDDIDVSRYAYRWLKAVNAHFGTWPDVGGYTLQMENVNFVKGRKHRAEIPASDPVFLYRLFATWGHAPRPNKWRAFQDWFHKMRADKDFKPYIKDTILYHWYRSFEAKGTQDSMWEMWAIYYYYINNLYTVYSNLQSYSGLRNTLLDTNRMEAGLHFTKHTARDKTKLLLSSWDEKYVTFPSEVTRYDLDGANDHNVSTSHWDHIIKQFNATKIQ